MISTRFAPILFAAILSGIMSFLVTGIATLRISGLVDGFVLLWLGSWLNAWIVACPAAFFVAPVARRFVTWLTTEPKSNKPRPADVSVKPLSAQAARVQPFAR